ncbi:hypothetical protein ABPG77_010413 [Micractinium sp. CCAP 211/92]
MEGAHQKQYAWDPRQGRLRALEPEDWEEGEEAARTLRGRLRRAAHDLRSAFFPHPDEVSPDYWDYVKYRACHRLFSSMSSIFATQSLLQAVGVGAKRSLPAAATINWVLKDGLGRLGPPHSGHPRFRYTTSVIYAVSLSLEYLTPLAPQHFLPMASLANVGKSIGLTTFIATQPAFHRSFCLRENIADISAKTQAQQMVLDNLGLAAAVGLTYLCRNSVGRMPLTICSLERAVRSSQDVQLLEGLDRDDRYFLTFSPPGELISSSDHATSSSASGDSSSRGSNGGGGGSQRQRWQRLGPPLLPWRAAARGAGSVRVCLRQDAAESDIVQAVLQAAYLRQLLGVPPAGSKHPVAVPASLAAAAANGSSGGGDGEAKLDLQRAVAQSGTLARGSLAPFISQLDPPGSPVAFADRRPLPAGSFPDAAAVLQAEGATYFWLYRLIQSLEAHLPCALAGDSEWDAPAGWELVSMLNITEPGGQEAPFAAVILNEEASKLVVALRGTMLPGEWALDFSYNQTEFADNLFGSPVHYGFGSVFEQLWPDVQAALSDLALGPSSAASQVFIAGHSLGGGVATLLAYAAQQFLRAEAVAAGARPGNSTAAVVSALLVAPPSVGPPDFVARFNQLVNARRLAFQYDIVPQAFCSPYMPACSGSSQPGVLGDLLNRAGMDVIPTNEPGNVSSWSYATVGGSLPFGPASMPQDAVSWPALRDIQLCWSLNFLMATHVCSYACFTSQFAPPAAAAQSSCWLSARPEGSPAGVQCTGWPAGYPTAA